VASSGVHTLSIALKKTRKFGLEVLAKRLKHSMNSPYKVILLNIEHITLLLPFFADGSLPLPPHLGNANVANPLFPMLYTTSMTRIFHSNCLESFWVGDPTLTPRLNSKEFFGRYRRKHPGVKTHQGGIFQRMQHWRAHNKEANIVTTYNLQMGRIAHPDDPSLLWTLWAIPQDHAYNNLYPLPPPK
jgi:hypothetical protein